MLRCKQLDCYFSMDTFHTTKKKGLKSTRGNTYCQLFVTDKVHLCTLPMRKDSEVLLAMKLIGKDLRVPEAITTYASAAEMSREVRSFCINIGTALKKLE